MATYWLDLFTGMTWNEFVAAGATVSGFRESRWRLLQKMRPGDRLLCYVTGISRWIGLLEVTGEPYLDKTPIWSNEDFPARIPVRALILLKPENAVPVHMLSDRLSYMVDSDTSSTWTGHFRGSPARETEADALVITQALEEAQRSPTTRPFSQAKWNRRARVYQSSDGPVTIPEESEAEVSAPDSADEEVVTRLTHEEMQWMLLKLGHEMGFELWVAKNDRGKSFRDQILGSFPGVRDSLPTQFDAATSRTIELIDVLWLERNGIAAAFEVEHTTSIYSGLLRMSDLVAMQPNLSIRLFIVAPDERRQKVLDEIGRPTFSRRKPPLHEYCRYISYSELQKAEKQFRGFLHHMRPEFLEEIAESASPE